MVSRSLYSVAESKDPQFSDRHTGQDSDRQQRQGSDLHHDDKPLGCTTNPGKNPETHAYWSRQEQQSEVKNLRILPRWHVRRCWMNRIVQNDGGGDQRIRVTPRESSPLGLARLNSRAAIIRIHAATVRTSGPNVSR